MEPLSHVVLALAVHTFLYIATQRHPVAFRLLSHKPHSLLVFLLALPFVCVHGLYLDLGVAARLYDDTSHVARGSTTPPHQL
jgi:Na+/H+ antiporter NhaD/arsenite permease-like protein